MNNENEKKTDNPIVQVAGFGAGASVGIAAIIFLLVHEFTDIGIFAVALMIAAPCAMAYGICMALIKQNKS